MNISSKVAASKGLLLAVCLAAAMAVWAVGPTSRAFATQPIRETFTVNRTFQSPFFTQLCGFPVSRHNQGTIEITHFIDSAGNDVRELDRSHIDFSISANVHTLTGTFGQIGHYTFHADGSLTFVQTGATYRTVLPGQGPIFADTGRTVYEFAPDGSFTITEDTGLNVVNAAAMCSALAP